MKYKTTQKAIKSRFSKIISVPYCNLQSLLSFENPIAYTARREGWGADIYAFGDIAIATGYAPFGNVKTSYEVTRRYEKAAGELKEALYNKRVFDYETLALEMGKLIDQFIREATEK
jgi:hypothetical protein